MEKTAVDAVSPHLSRCALGPVACLYNPIGLQSKQALDAVSPHHNGLALFLMEYRSAIQQYALREQTEQAPSRPLEG